MSTSAGIKLLPSLDWLSNAMEAPFPLFIERLVAFIAAVNATAGNEGYQLALPRTHLSSLANQKRGLVLQLGTPSGHWIVQFFQTVGQTSYSSVTFQGAPLSLWTANSTNDGYGTVASSVSTSAEGSANLKVSGTSAAAYVFEPMEPQPGPSAVVFAQDTTPGAEWFVFSGDSAAAPMTGVINPNPWSFLLARDPVSLKWMVCLRRLTGWAPNAAGSYGPVIAFRPNVQGYEPAHRRQLLVNRPQLVLQSRRLSASGTTYSWLSDPQPYRMPAAIWFGPCNSNPVTYPGRANDVHGTFVLGEERFHQLGRAVDPDWWISFPVATPPAAVAGWTSFADFSWRPRTSRLTLQEIPQVVSGSELTPADPRSRPYAPVALLLVNDLLEPMAEAGLAYRDVVIDPGGGGGATGGGQRPTEGVLWPPPPPEWGGSSSQQD